jgi:hypothetical protein
MKITIESDDDIESFTWTATYKSKALIDAEVELKRSEIVPKVTEAESETDSKVTKVVPTIKVSKPEVHEEIPQEMLVVY